MRRIKKTIAVVLAFGMLASGGGTGNVTPAEAKAAKKPSVAKKAMVMEGQDKSLSVKMSGYKLKSITVKSSDKSVLKVKAKKKTKSVILTGVKPGFAKVTTTVTVLKNKKPKKYKLTTSVIVKAIALSGYENIDVDYDVDTGKVIMNASVQMGLSLIDMFVPGGKIISKGLGSIYSDLTKGGGSGDKSQLKSISEDIESLRKEINNQVSLLKDQIDRGFEDLDSRIVSQSIISSDGALFDKLSTSIDATVTNINAILKDETINDETKAVFIAGMIGKYSQWNSDDNNLLFLFKLCMNSLSSASFKNQDANTDLYDIAYQGTLDRVKSKVMFSGEVKNISDKYIQKLTLLGLKAYMVLSYCLKAHQLVSTITEDQVAPIGRETFKSIQTLQSLVDSEIVTISKKMFDTELKDSVACHLNKYMQTNKTIFLNYGKNSTAYKEKLKTVTLKKGADGYEVYKTCLGIIEEEMPYANPHYGSGNQYTDEIYALKSYVCKKGISLGQFLSEVGFDISDIDDNALFITAIRDQGFESYPDIILEGVYLNKIYPDNLKYKQGSEVLWKSREDKDIDTVLCSLEPE